MWIPVYTSELFAVQTITLLIMQFDDAAMTERLPCDKTRVVPEGTAVPSRPVVREESLRFPWALLLQCGKAAAISCRASLAQLS